MGAYVFNNQIFDSWLNRMSDEILSKVNREKITTEEMIILILKAQTNHFHHMDVDMKEDLLIQKNELSNGVHALRSDLRSQKDELKKDINFLRSDVQKDIRDLCSGMQEQKAELKHDISTLRSDVQKDIRDLRSDMLEQKAELKNDIKTLRTEIKTDIHKLDSKMDSRFMWTIGVTITMSLGLYIKLFLG
ncbi:MAG: hypothetical protein PHY93_10035 [Bacteriovorax sp.]|nr:hypothetical protein [Bacteriovorax sp.]